MTFEWDADERGFLDAQSWAVLATGRRDGSPQQSMVGYAVDDQGRVVISAKSFTAKYRNAVRQPRVCLTVPAVRTHLVIYGTAETIEADPLRAELTAAVFAAMSGNPAPDPASIVPLLDEQKRTVIRITPLKTVYQE